MKILKTPWKSELLRLVHESKRSVKITSPFVKHNMCSEVLKAKRRETKFEIITSFKLMSVYSGSLDLNALDIILKRNGVVKNYSKLHAKMYLFDEERAIVTSGNLTHGGLVKNFEYGLFIDDHNIVSAIADDYQALSHHENTGLVKLSDVQTARRMLEKIARTKPVTLPTFQLETETEVPDVIETDIQPIASSLSGWRLDVFTCLNQISKEIFFLSDVYKFEPLLKSKHQDNKHVKDKIRQQLQGLKAIGLIEFLGSGKYRKLWKQAVY